MPFDSRESPARSGQADAADTSMHSGPFAEDEQEPVETIHEIRVHGNAAVPDADVIKLAGIALGDTVSTGRSLPSKSD